MKIRSILVPIDFSDCSKNALKYAIKLAQQFEAKIHMINAVHVHSPHPNLVGGSLIDAVIMDYESEIKKSFDALEKEIIELNDVPHTADRYLTYLIDAIYTHCHQNRIDLVVMGTRAEHQGLENLLGSRATDVIANASVPVLVIPENWTKHQLETIGLAFTLEPVKNPDLLRLLNEIRKIDQSKVSAFSIVEENATITVQDQKVLSEVVSLFDEGTASAQIIEAASVKEGIIEFAEKKSMDAIALIPKEHSFFEKLFKSSVTKSIALKSNIPILAFRE